MLLSDIRQELSRRVTSGKKLGLSVTSERIGRQYVYLDISGIWDNILGHFGPKTGLFGQKIGQKIGLFGPKIGLFGHFLGHFGPKIDFFGKNGQMRLFTEFCRYKCHFLCIPVYEWILLMEKDLEQLKLVNYVISAILEISGKTVKRVFLLNFAALSVIFCVSRFTNAISRWRES